MERQQRGRRKKLIAWVRWLHGANGYGGPELCRQCKQARGEPTQCNNCEEPELFPENREAVQVFWDSSTQWRVSMGGITGLDYPAVNTVMKWLGVTNKKRCFEKIRVLESEQLSILHGQKNKH